MGAFLVRWVPRNVGRDVWVQVLWNGGKGRRNAGRMRGGFIIICGGGDGCHQGVFLWWCCCVVKSILWFCRRDCIVICFIGDGSGGGGGGGSGGRCTGGLSWSFFCDILTIDFYIFYSKQYLYLRRIIINKITLFDC